MVLLAPQLRRIRLEQALTQEELAEKADVDRTTIMRAEAGLKVRISTLAKLARALKVSPQLLQRADD